MFDYSLSGKVMSPVSGENVAFGGVLPKEYEMDISPAQILFLPVLWFSITVHEFGHAYAAMRGGDDTAKLMGRVSLDPLHHIDLIGTIIVPILQVFGGIPLIGWAKPVPVNPAKLRSRKWDVIVSLAGVTMNLALAILAAIVLKILMMGGVLPDTAMELNALGPNATGRLVLVVFRGLLMLNLVLIMFNLLPIPPLDGSHILLYFIKTRDSALFKAFQFLERYGIFVLLILLYSGGLNIILTPIGYVIFGLCYLFGIPFEILFSA